MWHIWTNSDAGFYLLIGFAQIIYKNLQFTRQEVHPIWWKYIFKWWGLVCLLTGLVLGLHDLLSL